MTYANTLRRPGSIEEIQKLHQQSQRLIGNSIKHGLAFQPQPSDVFIAPFGQCGTTWLQQIVHGLKSGGDMSFSEITEVIPWLEMAQLIGLDLQAPQPGPFRAYKSHLSWSRYSKRWPLHPLDTRSERCIGLPISVLGGLAI